MFEFFNGRKFSVFLITVIACEFCFLIAKVLEKYLGKEWLFAWIGFLWGIAFCYLVHLLIVVKNKLKSG
jgi:hypothetical protein